MNTIIQTLQQDVLKPMYRQHGVSYLGVFGSTARGEMSSASDVDLLVDFDSPQSLFDLAEVKIFFQDLLGKKVDLVLKDGVKSTIRPYIYQDLIDIYEQN